MALVSRPASRPNLDGLGLSLGLGHPHLGLGLGLGGPGLDYNPDHNARVASALFILILFIVKVLFDC